MSKRHQLAKRKRAARKHRRRQKRQGASPLQQSLDDQRNASHEQRRLEAVKLAEQEREALRQQMHHDALNVWGRQDDQERAAEEVALRRILVPAGLRLAEGDPRLPEPYEGGVIPHRRAVTLSMMAAAMTNDPRVIAGLHNIIRKVNADEIPNAVKAMISNGADPMAQINLLAQYLREELKQ